MRGKAVGRYYLQAAIASKHASAATPEETDWRAIARLYDLLAEAAPGPVVEVNRAMPKGDMKEAATVLAKNFQCEAHDIQVLQWSRLH